MGLMTIALIALPLAALVSYPVIRRFGRLAFIPISLVPAAVFVAFALHGPVLATGEVLEETLEWVPQLDLDLALRLDAIAWVFALLVTGAGALVLLYCTHYFEDGEEGLARFGSVFLGFAGSMLGLVLADNVYLLFVFWEGTTVFSFLLIGHMARQRTARAAALQALIVTTLGGLAMLVGLVLLAGVAGTPRLSAILADPPTGTLVTVAVFLVLIGALSKSAIFPFHFWLPGAMAAPTPVSAYLHAAAMVKAGVYLVARLGPGFGDVPGFRIVLVTLGAITLLNGGIRALRQFDIKQIVAHGTVSQLGLLVMVFGIADPRTDFAGYVLLLAHALAKAPLFLIVGIVDHSTGTRDLRRLSGVGRRLPVAAVIATLSAASMAGLPPFLGFVAKESAFAELLGVGADQPLGIAAFAALGIGSVLTVAYMARFLWGAFATKRGVTTSEIVHAQGWIIFVAPAAFAALATLGGVAAPALDRWLRLAASEQPGSGMPEHLALWHGFTPPLAASAAVISLGLGLGALLIRHRGELPTVPERFSASHLYWVLTHWLDVVAVRLTAITQRGSLPFYLAVILGVFVIVVGGTLLAAGPPPGAVSFATTPAQVAIAVIVIIAAVFTVRAHTRFQAVILVGVTGYGMALIFALHGAPDLALTQVLVETITLIAFVLVIRRLPQHIGIRARLDRRIIRAGIGVGVGLVLGGVAFVALGSRVADPISLQLPELAHAGGHGANVVNVMLVDIRGWDTMGELSVILAAATGVASLVFLNTRVDTAPKLTRRDARSQVNELIRRVEDPNDPAERRTWLLAGRNLDPSRRSILLEVVVRLIFHALILLSFYLLLVGHNSPGGGFAGGLVAGLALVARYLTGGREELGATVPIDAGRILGTGLALAATVAVLPLFFGEAALSSVWFDLDLGPLGTVPIVSSTFFDIGVYLVVFSLVLDVLRSLGAEVDRHEETDLETALHESAPVGERGAGEAR